MQDKKVEPAAMSRSAAIRGLHVLYLCMEDAFFAFVAFIIVGRALHRWMRALFPPAQCDRENKTMSLACYVESPPPGVVLFVLSILAALAVYTFKQRKLNRVLQGQYEDLTFIRAMQEAKIKDLQNELATTKKKAAEAARDAESNDVSNASKFANLSARFTELQNDHEQFRVRYKTVQDELQARVAVLQSDYSGLQMSYKTAQDELESLRVERDELKKRVETQAAELAAASANEVTSVTEQVAASGITGAMQELNTMIYRIAMRLISVTPASAGKGSPADEPLRANARTRAVEAIGERLLNLATTRGKDDYTILAAALQSGLVHACFLAISRVTGRVHEPDVSYRQIWLNDKQGVVSRSRASTNQRTSTSNEESAVVEVLLTMLASILLSIGWNDEPQHIRSRLRKESENLDRIATLVVKISKIIREIKSDVLQVTYVQPGEEFDASLMRTEGEESSSPVVKGTTPVLGVVALGLALRVRSGGQKPLLEPIVVLDSHASSG